jgi:hypothetical protein
VGKLDYNDQPAILKHLRNAWSGRRTICEVHREIYDLVLTITDPELCKEIVPKIIDVYIMGNKMNDRLNEYKKNWEKDFYGPNEDWSQDSRKRNQREKGTK